MSTLIYLVNASVCLLSFYLLYGIAFQYFTFFTFNRWYIVGTLVLSFIIPALQLGTMTVHTSPVNVVEDEHTITGTASTIAAVAASPQTAMNWNMPEILLAIYAIVGFILCIKLIISVSRLVLFAVKNGKKQEGYIQVKHEGALSNCSFFNIIFISNKLDKEEQNMIISHELEHVRRFHSIDNLLFEVAKVVLWFHPIVYNYKNVANLVHEYEADAAASDTGAKEAYANLLLKLSGFSKNPLVNNFGGSQLSFRVKMLFNGKTRQIKKVLYALLIPLIATLTWYFSMPDVYANTHGEYTVIIDAGHGGDNNGATVNGIHEKDLMLDLAKAVKNAGDASGLNIILTRNTDKAVALNERVGYKADLFISLHANYADQPLKGALAITANKPGNNGSDRLANACLAELSKLSGIAATYPLYKNQKMKVLELATMPAVLLEVGYMSNPGDLQYISDPDNQTQIANAIVAGIKKYQAQTK